MARPSSGGGGHENGAALTVMVCRRESIRTRTEWRRGHSDDQSTVFLPRQFVSKYESCTHFPQQSTLTTDQKPETLGRVGRNTAVELTSGGAFPRTTLDVHKLPESGRNLQRNLGSDPKPDTASKANRELEDKYEE